MAGTIDLCLNMEKASTVSLNAAVSQRNVTMWYSIKMMLSEYWCPVAVMLNTAFQLKDCLQG